MKLILFILITISPFFSTDLDPVAGIILLPIKNKDTLENLENTHFYASYAKWLGQLRIRWIPIYPDDDEQELKNKLDKCNIIFFTGGSTELTKSEDELGLYYNRATLSFTRFGKFSQKVIKYAMTLNDHGIYKPIWGTCQGMQILTLVCTDLTLPMNGGMENLNNQSVTNFNLDSEDKFIFDVLTKQETMGFSKHPYFHHNHHFGFELKDTKANKLFQENFDIVSWAVTLTNKTVVDILAHKTYPFLATQFHPEASQFNFNDVIKSSQSGDELDVNRRLSKIVRRLIGEVTTSFSNDEIRKMREGINLLFQNDKKTQAYFRIQKKQKALMF